MAWSKVSNKRWERPLDGLEGYFATVADISAGLCDGRVHNTMFSRLTLEMDWPDTIGSLRHAWKQVRYEQPQLATTAEGTKMVYEVPDEGDLQEWLRSTFIVSTASDAEELFHSSSPIKQPTLYYLPDSSEIVFRGPHHTLDGIGVLMFWDKYLSALSLPKENITFGDEPTRLAPTMDEVLGLPEQSTLAQNDKAMARLISWAQCEPGIGPAPPGEGGQPAKCQNAEVVFSADVTKALVKACKSKGISVTAAVHAAYLKAVSRHADPKPKPTEYVTVCSVDLRKQLPEPYSLNDYAVSVYCAMVPCNISFPASYQDTAESLNAFYQTTKGDEELPECASHFGRVMRDFVRGPEPVKIPARSDALISSLGIVENHFKPEYLGGIKVRDMKFGLEIVLGMSVLYVYTFRHQLRLVYCFNGGYERREDIQRCLDEVQAVLARELLGLAGEN